LVFFAAGASSCSSIDGARIFVQDAQIESQNSDDSAQEGKPYPEWHA
jgi:hypothetical protein